MHRDVQINFLKLDIAKRGTLVIFVAGDDISDVVKPSDPEGIIQKVLQIQDANKKNWKTLEILAPAGSSFERFLLINVNVVDNDSPTYWQDVGGRTYAALDKGSDANIVFDLPNHNLKPADATQFAQGILLRNYRFDRYKTDHDKSLAGNQKPQKISIRCSGYNTARRLFVDVKAVVEGVDLARDLINEPANILGPAEFAVQAQRLSDLGVKVTILSESEMSNLGMGALLGVGQGSVRRSRLAVMEWSGGKAKSNPIAFVGKGVVFDTGGISIKPSAGMEDMKGDMGGAAAVTGLMHTLASRKARVNVVGIIGLVENMPDGAAQRPGDIVTSMSGQTIEIINTDAEGRLVLADALWYCKEHFNPKFMIDLATLTGAIIVALGHDYAGLFSNDDQLAGQLAQVGHLSGEPVWRLPLGKSYDKLIDSKFADVKNSGGRKAGSITAAQFLQRFVGDVPWAHLDIAGTAMGPPPSDTNTSWGSGYGVRLLDRLVREYYER